MLTDVTEQLMSATKFWVYGAKSGQSPSLLAAVSRITSGCVGLARKPFLRRLSGTTVYKTIEKTANQPLRELFLCFAAKLTHKAIEAMWQAYETGVTKFDVYEGDGDGVALVDHKKFHDVHSVDATFKCTLADSGVACWLQSYSGLVCVHGLVSCVDVLSRLARDKTQERLATCGAAVAACHSNWLRSVPFAHAQRPIRSTERPTAGQRGDGHFTSVQCLTVTLTYRGTVTHGRTVGRCRVRTHSDPFETHTVTQ